MPARLSAGLLAGLALLATLPAYADWSGRSEVGFVMARGNSETETANAKLELVRSLDNWKHTFGLAGLYGHSNDVKTAERWDTRWQTDHRFSDSMFWFGSVRYIEDRYSGFEYQASVAAGAGRTFVDSEDTKLSAQIGAGYRRLRSETLVKDERGAVIERIPGEKEGDLVANGVVKFEHAFNDATKVLNSLQVESGRSNTLTENSLALQVKMNSVLALSLGLTVRNNSNPPPPLEQTDTLTTVNLVYEMK